jgi:hypothetical protein
MHQALLVPEVLLEIFTHVAKVILKPFVPARIIVVVLYRESLAALATTCKASHEHAMNLLWDEVYCRGRLVSAN